MANNLGRSNEKSTEIKRNGVLVKRAYTSYFDLKSKQFYSIQQKAIECFVERINRKISALIKWRLRKIGIKNENISDLDIRFKVIKHECGMEGKEIYIIDSLLGERWLCDIFIQENNIMGHHNNIDFVSNKLSTTSNFFYR